MLSSARRHPCSLDRFFCINKFLKAISTVFTYLDL
jgi:hypothetical protein